MLIYCDSMILMYFFDHTGSFQVRASNRLTALAAAGDQIGASHLVRLECRIKPIKNGDAPRLALYDAFFARRDVRILSISPAVFDRATLIRAAYNFKLGDSLHLAAAAEAGCDRFLTNDIRLSAFTDIPVEVLP